MEALLLDDRDIARIVEAPNLRTVEIYDLMPGPSGRQYSDEVCGAAFSSASTTAYGGSGFIEVHGRRLLDSEDDSHDSAYTGAVDQAVIIFPSQQAARTFLASAQRDWAACAGTAVETRDGEEAGRLWEVGQPTDAQGVLSLRAHRPNGWSTQHAVGVQQNIVIDVSVTMDNVGDQGATIVHRIAERFSQ